MRKFEKENEQAGGGCCYGVTGGAKAAFGMLGALFLSGVSGNALAQCVATTDCATLGYTESSCPDGGVKCPFGDKWACLSGSSDGAPSAKCEIGWILYSDKSCSSTENYDIRKTPIGVVVYTYPDGGGIAMALETLGGSGFFVKKCCSSLGGGYPGSVLPEEQCLAEKYTEDFASLVIPDATEAARDFDSCGNTKILAENGYNISGVTQYATEGTSAGDWCLPAAGVMKIMLDNLDILNSTQTFLKGSVISDSVYGSHSWLSSTFSFYTGLSSSGGCNSLDYYSWGVYTTGSGAGIGLGSKISSNRTDSSSGSNVLYFMPVLEF